VQGSHRRGDSGGHMESTSPDGFTIAFYRNHWHTIKKDFLRMGKNVKKKWEVTQNLPILLWSQRSQTPPPSTGYDPSLYAIPLIR